MQNREEHIRKIYVLRWSTHISTIRVYGVLYSHSRCRT